MANRIIRDWTDSESVNALSANAEVFFVRLIMKADANGRHIAAPQLLKAYLYPLKDVRGADISRWCAECVDAGLIAIVESNGKRYVEIRKFTQPGKGKSTAAQPVKLTFDYEGDCKIHGINKAQLELWKELFPAVDVEAELRAASAWLDGHRKNRKTDIRRFITSWLIRHQDRAKAESAPGDRGGNNKSAIDYDDITAKIRRRQAKHQAQDDLNFEG